MVNLIILILPAPAPKILTFNLLEPLHGYDEYNVFAGFAAVV
jgi:hypothetical protein